MWLAGGRAAPGAAGARSKKHPKIRNQTKFKGGMHGVWQVEALRPGLLGGGWERIAARYCALNLNLT